MARPKAKASRARSSSPSTEGTATRAAPRPRPSSNEPDGERAVLAAIAAMPEPDRTMGERLHVLIRANAPGLTPRTWYGMPAYAQGGAVVCFFRSRDKFKERYLTLGFNDEAKLDEGALWPVVFALTALTATEEARVVALVKRAVG